MSFGNNLVNLRKQKGWSQDELADNLNLSRQAISKWENDLSMPDVDNVKKISRVFSVGIDELLNNEVPKDKAVALDIKKQDKKDKIMNLVKTIFLALVIIYLINVIYKFASLLVIVNGVSAYQNLNNYHYTITTYDENGLAEKEECWYKDGVSRTESTVYTGDYSSKNTIYVNYNDKYAYATDNNDNRMELDFNEYNLINKYEDGRQYYMKLPSMIQKDELGIHLLGCLSVNRVRINITGNNIVINTIERNIVLNKEDLLPKVYYDNGLCRSTTYKIEFNSVEDIQI